MIEDDTAIREELRRKIPGTQGAALGAEMKLKQLSEELNVRNWWAELNARATWIPEITIGGT